jgi:hypothetical protein
MDYFKASGKQLIAYMDSGSEKEYYLALGCDEVWKEVKRRRKEGR